MSDRRISQPGNEMRDLLRQYEQRISRLETRIQSLQLGLTSNGNKQLLANRTVQIEVTKSGLGDGRDVTFRNLLTGSEETISLP